MSTPKKCNPNGAMSANWNSRLSIARKLVDFFVTEKGAIKAGREQFGMGIFSVQPVHEHIVDLGWQGHVLFPPSSKTNEETAKKP